MKKDDEKVGRQMLIALSILAGIVSVGLIFGPEMAVLILVVYVAVHISFIRYTNTRAYLHSHGTIKRSKTSPQDYLCPFCHKVLYYEEIVQQKCSGCKESIKWSDRI